jgi:hypothetical protein
MSAMHQTIVAALFLVLVTAAPSAVMGSDAESVCAQVLCRPASTVKLRLDGDRVVEAPMPKGPYFHNGVVSILPGETLYLEADDAGGQLSNTRAVAAPKNKANTIVVKLEQLHDPKLDRHMLLTVTNPFSKPLRYQAAIQRAGTISVAMTSACAVQPASQNYEHWPEPLVQVMMKHLHFPGPSTHDDDKGCY